MAWLRGERNPWMGLGEGSTVRQEGSWGPYMRVKAGMGVAGREERVLETREP